MKYNYIHLYSKRIQKNAAQLWQWHQMWLAICDLPAPRAGKIQVGFFHQAVCRGLQAWLGHGMPRDGAELRGLDLDHPLSRRANFWPNPRPCGSKMDQKWIKAIKDYERMERINMDLSMIHDGNCPRTNSLTAPSKPDRFSLSSLP